MNALGDVPCGPRAPQPHRVVGLWRGSGTGHEPQGHDDADQARGGTQELPETHRALGAFARPHLLWWGKKRDEQQAKHGDQARRPTGQPEGRQVLPRVRGGRRTGGVAVRLDPNPVAPHGLQRRGRPAPAPVPGAQRGGGGGARQV